MRSQAVIDAIAALSPGYDTRRQWPFAEHARRAGGRLVGPYADLSRTGLARRIGPTGLDEWGPHNLVPGSQATTSTTAGTNAPTVSSVYDATAGMDCLQLAWASGAGGYGAGNAVLTGDTPTLSAGQRYEAKIEIYVDRAAGLEAQIYVQGVSDAASAEYQVGSYSGPGWYTVTINMVPVSSAVARLVMYRNLAMASPLTVRIGRRSIRAVGAAAANATTAGLSAQDWYVPTAAAARYLPRIAYSPSLDVNGQPYTLTEQYGPELVTNGDLTVTTGWLTSGPIAAGSGVATGSASGATQAWLYRANLLPSDLMAGQAFRFEFDVVSISAGAIRGYMHGATNKYGPDKTTTGRYSTIIVANGSDREAGVHGVGFAGVIDNISIQEFLGVVPSAQPMCLGLQVEGADTTRATPTEDPSAWLGNGRVIAPNSAIAPDGQPTADRLYETAVSDTHQIYRTFAVTGGSTHYAKLWVREGDPVSRVYIGSEHFSPAFNVYAVIEIATGAVVESVGSPTVRREKHGNGWVFYEVAVAIPAGATNAYMVVRTTQAAPFVGDPSKYLTIWGTGFTNQRGSYIPNNTTGTALRVEDDWPLSGAAFTAAFGDGTDWAMVIDFVAPAYTGLLFEMAGASDRGVSNGVCALTLAGGSALLSFYAAGWGIQGEFSPGALPAAGQRVRIAVAYSANNMRASLNGGPVVKDTSGAMGGTQGRFKMGAVVGGTTQAQALFVRHAEARPGQGSTMSDAALQAFAALA